MSKHGTHTGMARSRSRKRKSLKERYTKWIREGRKIRAEFFRMCVRFSRYFVVDLTFCKKLVSHATSVILFGHKIMASTVLDWKKRLDTRHLKLGSLCLEKYVMLQEIKRLL